MRLLWSIFVVTLVVGSLFLLVMLKTHGTLPDTKRLIPSGQIKIPDWKQLARPNAPTAGDPVQPAERPSSSELPSPKTAEVPTVSSAPSAPQPGQFADILLFLRELAQTSSRTTDAMLKVQVEPKVERASTSP